MTDNQRKMLLDWMRKIHQLEYAHTFDSLKWKVWHSRIGVSAFVLSFLVALSFRFPEFDKGIFENFPLFLRHNFLVALGSTIVAVLTGLQTFLKPSEKSEQHKKMGMNYEKLRHRIETLLNLKLKASELNERINLIREEWENLEGVNVSEKNYQKAKIKVKGFNKYPEELGFIENQKNTTDYKN